MEITMLFFGAVIVIATLAFVAEPLRFLPEMEQKKKRVGGSYWGIYPGQPEEEESTESGLTVELHPVARKQQYIAGSITYSQGRGVNMSGRK
jgi:hypothetical protein